MKQIITMQALGCYGRFANQLFQYSFLRIYADKHGLEMQIPPWVGNYLFGLSDPPVTARLPTQRELRDNSRNSAVDPPEGKEYVDKNFLGYAQFHSSWYRPYMEQMRRWFQPTDVARSRPESAVAKLRADGGTPIGIHLRRGDYGMLYFYTTPVQWCVDWLRKNWSRFENPVLFLATEDASLVTEFAEYSPLLVEDLEVTLSVDPYPNFQYLEEDARHPTPRSMDFYPDFYVLTQCDVLLISNSTFSFFAAMLNQQLKECWRSHLPSQSFVQITPWDADVLTHDSVETHPGIKGTTR